MRRQAAIEALVATLTALALNKLTGVLLYHACPFAAGVGYTNSCQAQADRPGLAPEDSPGAGAGQQAAWEALDPPSSKCLIPWLDL